MTDAPQIPQDQLKELSRLQPSISFSAILLDWLTIALAIYLCVAVSFWFYPLAFVVIGSRFHALEGMLHEAAHFRLHPNKTVNDFFGELLIWPLGLSLLIYRKVIHMPHHRHLGNAKDPHIKLIYRPIEYFEDRLTLSQLARNCVVVGAKFPIGLWKHLSGCYVLLPILDRTRFRYWIAFQIATVLAIAGLSILYTPLILLYYFLFFILPHLWVAVVTGYLRLLAEHFKVPNTPGDLSAGGAVRTVIVSWPCRLVFWPHNLNYHQEHHWFPSVPFYRLPDLHEAIKADKSNVPKMNTTYGVGALVQEITAP